MGVVKRRRIMIIIAAVVLCAALSGLTCAGYVRYLIKEKSYIMKEQDLEELKWLSDKLSESVNGIEAAYVFDGGIKAANGARFRSLLMIKSEDMLSAGDTERLFVQILSEFGNQEFTDILLSHGWFSSEEHDYGVVFFSTPGKADAVFLTQYFLSSFTVWIDNYHTRDFENRTWQLSDYIDEQEFYAKLPDLNRSPSSSS